MSKAKFTKSFPMATIERRKAHGGAVYYLVRKTGNSNWYAGEGDTPRAAWADAWKRHRRTGTEDKP